MLLETCLPVITSNTRTVLPSEWSTMARVSGARDRLALERQSGRSPGNLGDDSTRPSYVYTVTPVTESSSKKCLYESSTSDTAAP